MRVPNLPQLPKRNLVPVDALQLGKNRFEVIVRSANRNDLVRSAVKLIRSPGVVEVLATTESGAVATWQIVTSNADVDLSWLGERVPHAKAVSAKAKSKGSYVKTKRGTWRVAMALVPVVAEGLERAKMIQYRGMSGISVWVADATITVGFVLEVATPRDGTQVCQSSLLNMASAVGVRCEIVSEPNFAARVESLSSLKG